MSMGRHVGLGSWGSEMVRRAGWREGGDSWGVV